MNKILITGCSGYIGSCLVQYLKKYYLIYGVDKTNFKFKKDKRIKFFNLNLKNFDYLNKLIKKIKPDLIIHLAAESIVDENIKYKKFYINNILTTTNILRAMKQNQINKIIFSSTASVYDEKRDKLKETAKINPKNKYGKTKLSCEKLILNSKNNFVIFRFFNVCSSITKYKVGEMHNPETHLIPNIVNSLINNRKLKVYGNNFNTKDGTAIRDYIHILDICDAIYKSSKLIYKKKISEILNLGNNKGYSVNQVYLKCCLILKKQKKIEFKKKRDGDPVSLVCNNKKAKKILKWVPKNSRLIKILNDEISFQKYLKFKRIKRKFN